MTQKLNAKALLTADETRSGYCAELRASIGNVHAATRGLGRGARDRFCRRDQDSARKRQRRDGHILAVIPIARPRFSMIASRITMSS